MERRAAMARSFSAQTSFSSALIEGALDADDLPFHADTQSDFVTDVIQKLSETDSAVLSTLLIREKPLFGTSAEAPPREAMRNRGHSLAKSLPRSFDDRLGPLPR